LKTSQSAIRNPQLYFSALIVILALAARLVPGSRTIDDSYITFRYARNLLAGSGFTYNPGESVLGTTTPLYTFLMAGLGALTGGANAPFPDLALGVNALADAATCLLLVRLGKRAGARFAGWAAALVWAVAPFSVTFAIGGLETSLYVLLLTGTVAAALAGRRLMAALLGALALLTRPDALILLGPLVLERIYSAWIGQPPQKISLKEILAFGLPVLAWGAFATFAFGSPLPHSVLAKAAAYRLEPNDALVRLIQHYATPFLEQNLLGAPLAVALGIVLYPLLFAAGALQAWKVEKRLLPWIAYPWLYLVTFALPNPLIFRWYLTPPLPAYFLFILMGMERIIGNFRFPIVDFRLKRLSMAADKTTEEKPSVPTTPQPKPISDPASQSKINNRKSKIPLSSWRTYAVLAILLAYPLIFSLSDWRFSPDHGPARPAPEMAFIKLELLYRQAAAQIAPDLDGRSVLAAGDVGVLGYYTPARILDTVGLNSPVSTSYYPIPPDQYVINYAIPARLVLDQQPDYLVVLEVYVRNTLLKDPAFLQQYRLVGQFDTDMYGSKGMLIFKK
jgi:hypothetical protein